MTETATATQVVVLGVDTHQQTHHAAIIDALGQPLADHEFPATADGYRKLLEWAQTHGHLEKAGVESSASYGAGLTRELTAAGVEVIEVNAPDVRARRAQGKSDQLDAYAAAMAVLTGRASSHAKDTTGVVESIRMLYVARRMAVDHRTQLGDQLRDLCTTAPDEFADQLKTHTTTPQRLALVESLTAPASLTDPRAAFVFAAKSIARRYRQTHREVTTLTRELNTLLKPLVPTVLGLPQVGPITTARLLITIGHNAERMRTEATFAKLVGVAPLPASSGKTIRHRLNRGGDRAANSALHMIVVGRIKSHDPTRAYLARRSNDKTKKEIIRCLKRYVARDLYKAFTTDLGALDNL
ncbi:IS110 family transposase [Gordonia terrae]|uniref:IS110 family transposase n=1 Tax=Gordonia terrae TaxID=2055 RepID=UPI00200B5E9E|nr:IS110 family transposase [Gordonia terrae]UPW09192.1 IS110 family transposase [Gordonia terrae]UPW09256.1 IS110 family transposase [Gordonia terrae]UPW09332.1 IS110 family transposase [Gordonia terrae]